MTLPALSTNVLGNRVLLPLMQRYFATRLQFSSKPHQFLFVLSHMRAGSSLLVHLLNTHPKICGYGETHCSYNSDRDLFNLVGNIKYHLKQVHLNEHIFIDKLLHDGHAINNDMISLERVKFVFLIREPHAAIASMLKLWPHARSPAGRIKAIKYYSNYYITRLKVLEHYAAAISEQQRMLFLTHDALVNRTQDAFIAFQHLLQVEAEFSEQYKTTPVTGKVGVGDPSATIAAGRVVRIPKSSSTIEIEPECLQAFENCTRRLGELCSLSTAATFASN
ncbi:MAG: hypothetical protein AAGB13_14750 [Cyanobacteria bacterium P01_F01_bin.33]